MILYIATVALEPDQFNELGGDFKDADDLGSSLQDFYRDAKITWSSTDDSPDVIYFSIMGTAHDADDFVAQLSPAASTPDDVYTAIPIVGDEEEENATAYETAGEWDKATNDWDNAPIGSTETDA